MKRNNRIRLTTKPGLTVSSEHDTLTSGYLLINRSCSPIVVQPEEQRRAATGSIVHHRRGGDPVLRKIRDGRDSSSCPLRLEKELRQIGITYLHSNLDR